MQITGVDGMGLAPAHVAAPVPPNQAAGNRDVVQAVKALNAAETFGDSNELTFQLDRNTRQPVIRIVNRQTKEVIDQIPAEYVLRLAQQLGENG
jgi:flagellar protein FlaG